MGRTDVSSPLLSPTTSMGIQDGYEKPMDGLMVGPAKKKNERLKSLDAMRGLTVVMMILVDNTGNWFGDHLKRQDPARNQTHLVWFGLGHSPWNQVSIADFVMPFFLFMVGCSMSLTFAKYRARNQLVKKAMVRTVKIFVIGILIQGGNMFTTGYNVSSMRIPGILQRIAWAYGVVSLMAIYLPKNTVVGWKRNGLWSEVTGSHWSRSFRFYVLHWIVAISFMLIYVAVTFGLYVPDWTVPATNRTVSCNVYGDLTPQCSAARLVDKWFLNWDHMCHDLFAHRLPECSSCYPEDCPIPLGSAKRAAWCDARFEPEGILSSIPTIMTTWIGMHYGLVLQHYKTTHSKLYICKFWAAESTVLVALGWLIHAAGFKMNKQLWSPSYTFFMAGMAGFFLLFFFAFLDFKAWPAGGDIVVVVMWAERDNFAQGEFAFFSPCIDPATNGFTSTVSNTVPCNQHHTTNAKIGKHGSAVTVSPSYQLSYASLPWMAAGTMGGLTLKKQFEKAFALHSGGTLDYLMVGTFNEHIAQPQPNPWPTNPAAMSMGMERDLFNKSLWVDMYGLRSRDLEPATEDGGYTWKIFESCMRVFRSKAAACSDTSELCCSTDTHTEPRLLWTPIWSFENAAGSNGSAGSAASDGAGAVTDNLLTADSVERALLLKANWTEICTPLGGSDQFCAGSYGSDPTPTRWEQGPFALHKSPLNLPLASTAVYRCTTTGTEGGGAVPAAAAAGVHTEDDGRLPKGLHFFSSSRACRGIGKMEATLGHAGLQRDENTPRSLRLCGGPALFYHRLDGDCGKGDAELEFVGFVH